jgi:phospholipid/cholesterol/gamma-HCH transport system substrate-binding protein
MRRKLSGVIVRVALFTAVCLVFTFALIAVFGQLRFEDRTGYHAVFSNISGLKAGNFVRIAGVEAGKVGDLTLHRDGTVSIDFTVDKGVRLSEGTKAVVRYENLIGDRYLALEEGPGPPRWLPPGATIPLARTSPALDIDALIGGFRPLFRALDPDQVNAMSGELLRIFQGQGGTLASVLAQTSMLTSTLAGRGELIGELITNLNTVLHTFGTRDREFSDGLAQRKTDISTGLAYINAAAGSIADLLVQARQPIKDVVRETDRMSGQVLSDRDYVDGLLKSLPDVYQVLSRQGLTGDYFGFYFCEVLLKLNGKGGNPIYVKLLSQPSGRCTPK